MKGFYFVLLSLVLVGCVSTKTTGYIDPDYRDGGFQVSKVVVRAEGATLEETQIAEQKLAEKFNAHGIEATKFMDIVPPTRNYSDKQIAKLLVNTGADSVFTVFIADKSTVENYVPPTYHPGTSTSYVNTIGNTAYVNTYSTPGYTTGGFSTSEPVMVTFSSLVDLSNGNNVWQAEGQSWGNEFSSFSDLLVSAGKDAIADLYAKGLLPEPVTEEKNTTPEELNKT